MTQGLVALLSRTTVWLGAFSLASFLALFWALRGSPVGQAAAAEEDEEAPSARHRDLVIAAASAGLTLTLVGAFLAVARGVAWSLPAFGAGFATVLALGHRNRRYRHASPALRRTLDVSNALLNAALFAGVLVVANVLAFRYGGRAFDLTREQAHSLSSLSVNQVKTLTRPVTFTTYFGRSPSATQQADRVQQLLELYKAVNPEKVRLESIDPFREVPRFEALAKRAPEVEMTQGGGVVIELGEGETADRVSLRNVDLFDVPRDPAFDPSGERFESVFKGEDAVTSALIRLRDGVKPRVVFTKGHGEPPLTASNPNRPSLAIWKSRLQAMGAEVEEVSLQDQEVPRDAALLVIVAPRSAFQPEELKRLRAYADRKGPLLVLPGDPDPAGLEAFLKAFHVTVGVGVVLEPRQNYRGLPDMNYDPVGRAENPILAPLENQRVLLPRPVPLSVGGGPGPGGLVASVLLRSSAESWSEPDPRHSSAERSAKAQAGPVVLGIGVTDRPERGDARPPRPRLVVYGSRYLADDRTLQIERANLDLLMNTVGWLRGRPELEGIAPSTHVSLTLTADPALRARLVLVPTLMAFLLILSLGLTTYLARRA